MRIGPVFIESRREYDDLEPSAFFTIALVAWRWIVGLTVDAGLGNVWARIYFGFFVIEVFWDKAGEFRDEAAA